MSLWGEPPPPPRFGEGCCTPSDWASTMTLEKLAELAKVTKPETIHTPAEKVRIAELEYAEQNLKTVLDYVQWHLDGLRDPKSNPELRERIAYQSLLDEVIHAISRAENVGRNG